MSSSSLRSDAAAGVNTSNHVYVRSDEYAWVPARLLECDSAMKATVSVVCYKTEEAILTDAGASKKTLQIVSLTDYPNQALPLQNVDEEGRLRTVQDMVDLPFLHEVCLHQEKTFLIHPTFRF